MKYVTQGVERIATLPLGYADGYTRMLTGKSQVLVQGQRVPVVGRICMDQCMINVTGLDVKTGDVVTLFGERRPTPSASTKWQPGWEPSIMRWFA